MTPSGSYQFKPTQSFIDSVDPDDARYTVCIGLSPDGYTTVNKFNYNAVSTCPFTISRFTEMYLIFAECAPDESGLAKLNELRAARNLPPLDKEILDNPSQYVDAILDERKIEFYGENQYFTIWFGWARLWNDWFIPRANISSCCLFRRVRSIWG